MQKTGPLHDEMRSVCQQTGIINREVFDFQTSTEMAVDGSIYADKFETCRYFVYSSRRML